MQKTAMSISIIIPTYNRPEYLKACVKSCLQQTRPADEILIGDDSEYMTAKIIIDSLRHTTSIPIRYIQNSPSLGQAANVDNLVSAAQSDYICLIHDDDLLKSNALRDLLAAFQNKRVVIAFGKQEVISATGQFKKVASENFNSDYFRTKELAGLQFDILKSAVIQQIPNNGFLVKSEAARKAGYARAGQLFGDACDFGFNILLAENYPECASCFVDKYTACYRLSKDSITRTKPDNDAAYHSFKYIYRRFRKSDDNEIRKRLKAKAPVAVSTAIRLGHWREAWKWAFSPFHLSSLISPGGIRRLVSLIGNLIKTSSKHLR